MGELQQQIQEWCESLTDYLKCDQCERKLAKEIYLCDSGHLICLNCSQKSSPSDKCSKCQKKYTKTRNYLAEDLSQKMETIKEKVGIPDDDEDDDDRQTVSSEASSASWNTFSCKIGFCKFKGSIDEIRQHYQEDHRGLYVKHCDDKLPHSTKFFLEYSVSRRIHRVLDIPNVGLFLLQIVIRREGALHANFFMHENKFTSNKFKYKLEIKCNTRISSVEGEVDPIRIPYHAYSKKGVQVEKGNILQVELANSSKFTCQIELDRNDGNPFSEEKPSQPIPSESKKKTRRNRNKSTNRTQQNGQIDQEKPKNNPNPNPTKTNPQKKQVPDVKEENGKKTVEKKAPEGQNHQSRVNNPLQMNGGNIPPSFPYHPPPFSPMNLPGGQQMGYQSPGGAFNYPGVPPGLPPQGLQHNPQHFGPPPGPFPGANPHYRPPPSPGTPGIPGANYGRPSAPFEHGVEAVRYPDLTPMKQKMGNDRFSEVQRKIDEKERARLARKSSTESKDKCVIC